MLTFRLHRKGVALVSIGAVLMGALLFGAGYLTGLRRAAPSLPALPSKPIAAPAAKEGKAEKQESAAKPHIEDEACTLRVGAFADEADAKAFVQELTARGHKPVVVTEAAQNGIMLHTVRIGRYAGRDEAAAAAAELKRKEGISAAVIPAAGGS